MGSGIEFGIDYLPGQNGHWLGGPLHYPVPK